MNFILLINQYCETLNVILILHRQIIKKEVQNDKEIFSHFEYDDYFNIIIQSKLSNS